MKDNSARIAIILDRSGSMASCRESTITGFNEFIKEQKKLPGEATVKLVQFDNEYEKVYDRKLSECREINQGDFVPRGATALLDAQGRTIIDLGKELESLPESERPARVIVVTITDGQENASREFTRDKIAEMIKHQRDVYNWDFVFLGANQDAIAVAATMNIPMASSMTYATTGAGIANTMRSVSNYVGASRMNVSYAFTADERKQAMAKDEDDNLVGVTPKWQVDLSTTTAQK